MPYLRKMQICCCFVTSLGLRSPAALHLRRATTRQGSSVALSALKVRLDKFQQVVDQCNYIPATASKLVRLFLLAEKLRHLHPRPCVSS
jgi:hypothetical protein